MTAREKWESQGRKAARATMEAQARKDREYRKKHGMSRYDLRVLLHK